ncbi:hypothetical protein D3C75_724750 [compost metagenome]
MNRMKHLLYVCLHDFFMTILSLVALAIPTISVGWIFSFLGHIGSVVGIFIGLFFGIILLAFLFNTNIIDFKMGDSNEL